MLFLDKAKTVHGDRYDYGKSVYVRRRSKVVITCRKHGDFEQLPYNHLNGMGCRRCQYEGIAAGHMKAAGTHAIFAERCTAIHQGRYTYDAVVWAGVHKKVQIHCTLCGGDFLQNPACHMQGQGCPLCKVSHKAKQLGELLSVYSGGSLQREVFLSGTRRRFDYYWPERNTYVEYDGRQHFVRVLKPEWKNSFDNTFRGDVLKLAWVIESGASMVRVPPTLAISGIERAAVAIRDRQIHKACLVIESGKVVNVPPKYERMINALAPA